MKIRPTLHGILAGITAFSMVFGVLVFPQSAEASLTIGNSTTSGATTFSVTTASTAEILVVGVSARRAAGGTCPSGVTFNGSSMTSSAGGVAGQYCSQFWYLTSPGVSTTANVVVSYSTSPDTDEYWAMDIGGGVDTDSPIGTTYNNAVTGAESRSLTPAASSGVFVSNIIGTSGTFTASSVTAVRTNTDLAVGVFFTAGGYVAHTGGSTTVSWSWTGDPGPQHTIAEIKEAAAAPTSNPGAAAMMGITF